MQQPRTLRIARRFNGPPDSGNGGYVCGVLAVATASEVRVRLLSPPPLDTPLTLVPGAETGSWRLLHGERPVAAAAAAPPLPLDVPRAPPYVQSVWASQHYIGFREHPFPDCFVCGPHRRRGDGMRIFPGLLDSGILAAPWIPADDLDQGDGKVAVEFHWAALDCPGYFAAIDGRPRPMLLGEMQAHVDRRVHVGETCMVISWRIATEGRKHRCGTAIFDDDGELCALAHATWIAGKD
jgi:hypothetical protein